MKILAQYIKEADNKIVSLGNKKLEERLATFLLYLHTEFYNTSQDGYPFYLKREEIANYIGVATESMIRMLKNFEQKNLIGLEGRKIILKDRMELERIAKGLT
jgi:CRP-like cAMP-binding protein